MKIERLNGSQIIITIETGKEATAFWDFANLTKESCLSQSALHGEISRQIDSWFASDSLTTERPGEGVNAEELWHWYSPSRVAILIEAEREAAGAEIKRLRTALAEISTLDYTRAATNFCAFEAHKIAAEAMTPNASLSIAG